MPNVPAIPATLTAGDSDSWIDYPDGYPATAGWALFYVLVGSSVTLTLDSVATGAGFTTDIKISESSGLIPETYDWQSYVSRGSGATAERRTLDRGKIQILANLVSTAPGSVPKGPIAQLLDLVTTAIEKRLRGEETLRYEIRGRRLDRDGLDTLIALRDSLRQEVKSEQTADSLQAGTGNPTRLKIRFGPRVSGSQQWWGN